MFRLVQLHPAQTLLVTQVVLPPPLCNSKIWSSRDSSVGTFLKLAKDVLHSSFGLRGMWELSLLLLNSPWDCNDCNQAEVRNGSTGSPKRCRCFWLLPRSNENVSGLSEPSSSSSYYSDCVLFPRLDSEESHSIYTVCKVMNLHFTACMCGSYSVETSWMVSFFRLWEKVSRTSEDIDNTYNMLELLGIMNECPFVDLPWPLSRSNGQNWQPPSMLLYDFQFPIESNRCLVLGWNHLESRSELPTWRV